MYVHNFAVPSIVVAVTYVTALRKKVMFGCAEYCLCYDRSFIRIHHQDGNYYITKAEATRINA